MKETVFVVLLALVSCQKYPDHGERAYPSPGLQLLTGGVSEFIVDGRVYGRDLPPLLTGEASFQDFENSRLRRQGHVGSQVSDFISTLRGSPYISIPDPFNSRYDSDNNYMIPLNNIIHGDDLVTFGRPRETYALGRVGSYSFRKGRRHPQTRKGSQFNRPILV